MRGGSDGAIFVSVLQLAAGDEPPLKIVADETKNSLLIMANDRDYQRVLRVIQGLDVVASQVLIEAVIAEVTLNDKLQYGVQWAAGEGRHADRHVHKCADRRRGSRVSRASTMPSTQPASRRR